MDWLEVETFKIEPISVKNGSLVLEIMTKSFEVSYTNDIKKMFTNALKLEPDERSAKTILLDSGNDELLYLTFRRAGSELVILWEQRSDDKKNDLVIVYRVPYTQFRTDFQNTMKEIEEEYKSEFESYRDL